MPSVKQLVVIAGLAVLCALAVSGILIAVGLGEHAPLAAAVSAVSSCMASFINVQGRAGLE